MTACRNLVVVSAVLLLMIGGFIEPVDAGEPARYDFLSQRSTSLVRGVPKSIATKWRRLADSDPRTVVSAPNLVRDIELLLDLGEQIQTISKWSVRVPVGCSASQVQLLASTVSAEAGFRLLRDDVAPANGQRIGFEFRPTAARWILIRIEALDGKTPFSVADISVEGYTGSPETRYRFNETPAAALDVLAGLRSTGSVPIHLSDDEMSLFRDAKDGALDDWTFAAASLLASGVQEAGRRKVYLGRIDQIELAARRIVAPNMSKFAAGEALLEWMHSKDGPFANGYLAQQTNVSTIIDDKTFNCVSSAVLYNIIGRRLGLDLRAIEVPDHAFSILYDGTHHADVETTNRLGFNPGRHASIRNQLEQQTGFRYIPDKHRDLRREVTPPQLVAIIYYNHGVTHTNKKKHLAALLDYFRAMSMDSQFDSAVKNALASLVNWGNELSQQTQFATAVDVIETGLRLAPSDASLNHNRRVVYSKWVRSLAENGESDEAIAVLRRARRRMPDQQFVSLQAWVFIHEAESLIESTMWQEALSAVERGETRIDEDAVADLLQWKAGYFLRRNNDAVDRQEFDEAMQAITDGLKMFSNDRRLRNNLAFTAQEWARYIAKTKGNASAREILLDLKKRFPDNAGVAEVAANFARHVFIEHRNAGRFEAALESIKANSKLHQRPRESESLVRDAYDSWAQRFMKRGEWSQAVGIYERGLGQLPADHLFKKNLVYCVQEWTDMMSKTQGADTARQMLRKQKIRFEKVDGIQDLADRWVRLRIRDLAAQSKFELAWKRLQLDADMIKEDARIRASHYLIDRWATSFHDQKKWQQALKIYDRGLSRFPGDRHFVQNATVTWHAWARPAIDAKQWPDAIAIYERALERFPADGSLQNNLRFCKQQLDDE
ncbi:MAG TPA: hypothetical protein EYG57_19990 [Planctomycetes bacterium]|nr:hypothetical protein [Planctomycetaceae bacterium]HIM31817.1 hypothetical protein [Planctomycetota bacterium]